MYPGGFCLKYTLADEMRPCVFFRLGQSELLLAERDALHQEGHVPREYTHRLPALLVHLGLALAAPVDAVPILARSDRHVGNREILVQLVERRRAAAAPRADHARTDLHRLVKAGAVKQPIQKRDQRRVRGCVVDRARDHKAVRRLKFRGRLVHRVVENAFSFLRAAPAGDTAADRLVADLHRLYLDAVLREDLLHLAHRDRRVAVLARTSVDDQNLHESFPFLRP